MDIGSIVSENFSEIAEMAASVGGDFNGSVAARVNGDNCWRNMPALRRKDKGKLRMISGVQGRTLSISFFTYKHGNQLVTWTYREGRGSSQEVASPAEVARRHAQLAQIAKSVREAEEREKKEDENKAEINRRYIAEYKKCRTFTSDFPYLHEKKLAGRVTVPLMRDSGGDYLAIPMFYPDGRMAGLQRIYARKDKYGRQKKFNYGADRKSPEGSFFLAGEITENTDQILVCEGWADAVSINLATGRPVYCGMDCGGMKKIIPFLLRNFAPHQITVAADDDCHDPEKGNPGILAALEISRKYGIRARKPDFSAFSLPEGAKPDDFSDLWCIGGAEEVRKQLTGRAKNSVVRAKDKAADYAFQRIDYCAKHNQKKQIREAVFAAVSYDHSDLKEIQKKLKAYGVSPEEAAGIYQTVKVDAGRRIRSLHHIRKNREDVRYIPLKVERQSHGGYQISPGQEELLDSLDDIIVLRSPMGSGKTEHVISHFLGKSDCGAYITHRISLTEEGCSRVGIMSYRGAVRADVLGKQKVGVCVNSLNHEKFGYGDWFGNLDTVCVDEVSKVFDHLCGPTIEDHQGIMDTFLSILRKTPKVLLCDADASDSIIDLLRDRIPDRKISVLSPEIATPMDHVRVNVCRSAGVAYEHIQQQVRQHNNVLVVSDSKGEVCSIKKQLRHKRRKMGRKELKILAIHAESRDRPEVRAWMTDPSRESKKWDVVIFNSCVDSGVSLVTEHFSSVVGIFHGVVSPDSVIQMMGRNRTAKEWLLVCHPHCAYMNMQKASEMKEAMFQVQNLLVDGNEEAEGYSTELSDFDEVFLRVRERDSRMRMNYSLSLRMMLEQKGYLVKMLSPANEHQKTLEKEMREAGKEIKDARISAILNCTAPSKMRYLSLKRQQVISEEEYTEVVRYECEKGLCKSDPDEEDIRFWTEGGSGKLKQMELLLATNDLLRDYDLKEMKKKGSMTLRKNLFRRGIFLKTLFDFLKLDRSSAEGMFHRSDAAAFITWLMESEKRKSMWNHLFPSSQLRKDAPACSTRFVQKILDIMGLGTTTQQKTGKRLSFHSLCMNRWKKMMSYLDLRREGGRHVADMSSLDAFPDEVDLPVAEDYADPTEDDPFGQRTFTDTICGRPSCQKRMTVSEVRRRTLVCHDCTFDGIDEEIAAIQARQAS